jgi:hypothetical protein
MTRRKTLLKELVERLNPEKQAMSLEVPRPVADYLAAEKAKDAESLARCFTDDGVVHDEGGEHRGHAEILNWKREADAKYRYVLEPLDASTGDETVDLRARLTGDFPGSPIELMFRFAVTDDKIKSLRIG